MTTDTTTQAQGTARLPELWDDKRIHKYALHEIGSYGTMTLFSAKKIMRQMRDEYEAKLDEYQAVYTWYIDLAFKTDERIQELEAQLAEAQEKIADAYTHGYTVANGWTGHSEDSRTSSCAGNAESEA